MGDARQRFPPVTTCEQAGWSCLGRRISSGTARVVQLAFDPLLRSAFDQT